jgi:hypothetical protein
MACSAVTLVMAQTVFTVVLTGLRRRRKPGDPRASGQPLGPARSAPAADGIVASEGRTPPGHKRIRAGAGPLQFALLLD